MRLTAIATFVLSSALLTGRAAAAENDYVALGDSITFGETNLQYVPSYGDRGYVGLYADYLAGRNGGVRPNVINLAIDGETASSFMTGSGRVPPVVGRTDAILAAENLHYDPNALVAQNAKFLAAVTAEKAAGNTIGTVSVTLGFNDLSTAVGMPASAVGPILAAYQANYGSILGEIRQQLPNAHLLVLGYYNPFPADPTSPAAPVFNAHGAELNGIISSLAAQYGGTYVDTAPAFVGHEAEYTYLAQMPAGSSSPPVGPYVGALPIGNVHPNATGYQAIAAEIEAVSEPSSVALVATGCLAWLVVRCRRSKGPLLIGGTPTGLALLIGLTAVLGSPAVAQERTLSAAPNPQMKAVLDELAALGPKPIETLTPAEARKQPSASDAVKALLKKQGKPSRVAVGGESAGGNLAAVTALRARDMGVAPPVHQLLIYPVTDDNLNTPSYREHAQAKPLNMAMMKWFWGYYLARPADEVNPHASPLRDRVAGPLPPATVIAADIDPLRSEDKAYADKLAAAGVKVVYANHPGVTHEFFGMGAVLDEAKKAVAEAAAGLKSGFGR